MLSPLTASLEPHAVAQVAARHGAEVVPLAVNVGPAGARNAGLAAVRTPYVAFVDSDGSGGDGGGLSPCYISYYERVALLQRAGARAVIFGNGADQQESVIKVLTPYTVPFAATIPTQTVLPYLAKLFTSALESGTNVSVRTATLHQGTGEQFFAPPYTLLDDTILVVGPLPTGGAPPTVVRPVRMGRATFNPATLNEDGWVGMPLVEATLDRRCAADDQG